MNIVCNKTKLVKLVRDKAYFFPFPIYLETSKNMSFQNDAPMYTLTWVKDGLSYKAFLAPVMGKPVLSVTVYQDGERRHRDRILLTPEELGERGMT